MNNMKMNNMNKRNINWNFWSHVAGCVIIITLMCITFVECDRNSEYEKALKEYADKMTEKDIELEACNDEVLQKSAVIDELQNSNTAINNKLDSISGRLEKLAKQQPCNCNQQKRVSTKKAKSKHDNNRVKKNRVDTNPKVAKGDTIYVMVQQSGADTIKNSQVAEKNLEIAAKNIKKRRSGLTIVSFKQKQR